MLREGLDRLVGSRIGACPELQGGEVGVLEERWILRSQVLATSALWHTSRDSTAYLNATSLPKLNTEAVSSMMERSKGRSWVSLLGHPALGPQRLEPGP